MERYNISDVEKEGFPSYSLEELLEELNAPFIPKYNVNSMREGYFKVCRVCLHTKRIAQFYANTKSNDGYGSICKTCKCKDNKEKYNAKKTN